MRLFNCFSLILLICCLLATKTAMSTKSNYDSSVLQPGSRIVAGDLSKNEFFILAANEPAPKKTIVTDQAASTSNKQIIPVLRTALKQTIHPSPKPTAIPVIKTLATKHTRIKTTAKRPAHKTIVTHHTVKYTYHFRPHSHPFVMKKPKTTITAFHKTLYPLTPGKIKTHAAIHSHHINKFAKRKITVKKHIALSKLIRHKQIG